MKRTDLSRRDFSKLTMAAFGGMVAGTTIGCSDEEMEAPKSTTPAAEPTTAEKEGEGEKEEGKKEEGGPEEHVLLTGKNVCRGLNTCMNKGASGENACAGQGTCATATAHTCHDLNECKGQGGCGETPGQNTCSKKGACAVPLSDDAWKKARAAFEAAMKGSGQEVGAAPAKG